MLSIGEIASKVILEGCDHCAEDITPPSDTNDTLRHVEDAEEVDESLLDEIRNYLDAKGAAIDKEMEARQAAGESVFWAVPATEGIIEDLKQYGMNGVKSLEDFQAVEASSEYSDAYKSLNGFRPRGHHWSDHTAEEWDKIINDLYVQARESESEKEEPYEHNNSDEPVNDMGKAFSAIGESVKRPKSVYQEMSEIYTEGVQSNKE